jgi:hypothetical protein
LRPASLISWAPDPHPVVLLDFVDLFYFVDINRRSLLMEETLLANDMTRDSDRGALRSRNRARRHVPNIEQQRGKTIAP